jgi:uncharacterized peroxidase-related enzyme
MSRLPLVEATNAPGRAKQLLQGVQAKLNITPNFLRAMANSPAVLDGYLALSGALANGSLPARIREEIALSVGEQNGCEYCVSAHSMLGKRAGLTEEEVEDARESRASAPREAAALDFARAVLAKRGRITDADFAAVRDAGFSNAEIAEIVTHVALNVFTNYFNIATGVAVDFPRVMVRNPV